MLIGFFFPAGGKVGKLYWVLDGSASTFSCSGKSLLLPCCFFEHWARCPFGRISLKSV